MNDVFKYGDRDPRDYISKHQIWVHAITEFLWPNSPDKEVTGHPCFGWWCYWRGDQLGLVLRLEPLPSLTEFLAQQERGSEYRIAGMVVFGELQKLWDKRWRLMPMLEAGRLKKSKDKQPFLGMRFCLIVLCLQHGLISGRGGRITWPEAKDSASLLLAATTLINDGRVPGGILRVPWSEIVRKAIEQRGKISKSEIVGDLQDYPDELPKSEGMEGLRYRLAVTLEESWPEVRSLAAAYCSHGESRAFNDWMKREGLDLWFSLKTP